MSDTIILGLSIPVEAKQLFVAGLLGLIIGLEREKRGKPASLKTFSMISVGSCLFTILSVQAAGGAHGSPYDMTRIAAQIVTGVGFLGAGVIFKTQDRIEGVTTAALIWLTAAIGMTCGFNRMNLVIWAFVVGVLMHTICLLYTSPSPRDNRVSRMPSSA